MQNSIEELKAAQAAAAAKQQPVVELVKAFSIDKPAAEYNTWTYKFQMHNGTKLALSGCINHRFITKLLNFAAMPEFSGGKANITSRYVYACITRDETVNSSATLVTAARLQLTALQRHQLAEEIYKAIEDAGQIKGGRGNCCLQHAGQQWEIDFASDYNMQDNDNPCILLEWKGYKN